MSFAEYTLANGTHLLYTDAHGRWIRTQFYVYLCEKSYCRDHPRCGVCECAIK